MKKVLSVIMASTLVFMLAACGKNSKDEQETPAGELSSVKEEQTSSNEQTSDEAQKETTDTTGTDSKSLVVYFSWSGNTENVAKEIQKQTGSDIFKIEPVIPYSDDYNTVVDKAQVEQRNGERPEIKDTINNIGDYDTIYVGFPNWWGDMPMILYTFFDTYDLSGKTVSLFCTSGGSGLSDTVNEVKSLEPDANVTKGLHIGSSKASSPESYVTEWLQEIGANN